MKYKFPPGFLWGSATAAYQVEGGLDDKVDYGVFAEPDLLKSGYFQGEFTESAGKACEQYTRFDDDIKMMADLGIKTYRFGIEMARIMPKPGEIDPVAIEHYREVLESCRSHGVVPVPTLHHFTSPRWLTQQGGWESDRTPGYFAQFARVVAQEYGGLIAGTGDQAAGYICTLNEVNTGRLNDDGVETIASRRERPWVKEAARRLGVAASKFTPWQFASSDMAVSVIMDTHFRAVEAIKDVRPDLKVGLTMASQSVVPVTTSVADVEAAMRAQYFREDQFLFALRDNPRFAGDFVGVQAYTHLRVAAPQSGEQGQGGRAGAGYRILDPVADARLLSPLGAVPRLVKMRYEFAPQALENCLRHTFAVTGLPMLATEVGIGTDDDAERIEFYKLALAGVAEAMKDGIPVVGALAWSMLDNYEWEWGYGPRFGLVNVDYDTMVRTPRESARWVARTACRNELVVEDSLLQSEWGPSGQARNGDGPEEISLTR